MLSLSGIWSANSVMSIADTAGRHSHSFRPSAISHRRQNLSPTATRPMLQFGHVCVKNTQCPRQIAPASVSRQSLRMIFDSARPQYKSSRNVYPPSPHSRHLCRVCSPSLQAASRSLMMASIIVVPWDSIEQDTKLVVVNERSHQISIVKLCATKHSTAQCGTIE